MKKKETRYLIFAVIFCCIAVALVVLKRFFLAVLPVIAALISYGDYTRTRNQRLKSEEEERKEKSYARRLLDEGEDSFYLDSLEIPVLESLAQENPDYFKSERDLRAVRESDGFNVKRYLFSAMPASVKLYIDPKWGPRLDVVVDGKVLGCIPPKKEAAVREALEAGRIQSAEVEIRGGPCKYYGGTIYLDMEYDEDYEVLITITLKG